MKTPRDLLFQRHADAGPKLDAIRRGVVARHCRSNRRESTTRSVGLPARLWLELFHSCRRVWVGLAAVWVMLLVINFSQRDPASANLAKNPPKPQMMMTFYNQERLLNELLADRAQPVAAIRPPKFEPKPRSENTVMVTI